MTTTSFDAPVLIAGGGLVGLSAAMFLAQYGVRSLAIERRRNVLQLPRAAFFHMRTIELFRSCGIDAEVRAQSGGIHPGGCGSCGGNRSPESRSPYSFLA